MSRALIGLLAVGLTTTAVAVPAQRFDIEHEGMRVGRARWEHATNPRGSRWRETLRVNVLALRQIERAISEVEVGRDSDGSVRTLHVREQLGKQHTQWRGTRRGEHMYLQPAAGAPASAPIRLPAETVFPDELETRLRSMRQRVEPRRMWLFDITTRRAWRATVHARADAELPEQRRVEVRWGPRAHPQQRVYWFANNGELLMLERALQGVVTRWTRCTLHCRAPIKGALDALRDWVVASPYRIPELALSRRLRLVLAREDGLTPELVATGDQSDVVDDARAIVTICAGCATERAPTAAELAHYLRANRWVQSDHPLLRAQALRAAPRHGDVAKRMAALESLTRARMNGAVDVLHYGDALSAWRTRSGDCTESALLLAALARAQGIPARVVAGMAYADRFSGRRDVFSPHLWVQAWVEGRWRSYDAALAGFDSSHVALAVGDGDPDLLRAGFAQLRQLRILDMGMVRE
jgi:hypothetical protein